MLRFTSIGASGQGPFAAPPVEVPEPTPAPIATPLPSRRERCEPSPVSKLYCIYTVQGGDTLSEIAVDLGVRGTEGVPAAEVLAQSNKPEVGRSDEILPGQKLRIPAADGIIHTAFAAQTVNDVATSYGVTAASIRALSLNGIPEANLLAAGQEIIVPEPEKLPFAPAPAAEPDETPTSTATPEPESTATPEPQPTSEPVAPTAAAEATGTPTPRPTATARATRTPTATPTPRPPASRTGFVWPATGSISSYFGPQHPLGIDIDFYADPNQPVRAAAAGTVTFAGGDACCSYGFYVIIDHGNGFTTLYAHFSAIAVRTGQRVAQGEVIGAGGRTGYATGNHLHFEVRKDDVVVNPMNYLP